MAQTPRLPEVQVDKGPTTPVQSNEGVAAFSLFGEATKAAGTGIVQGELKREIRDANQEISVQTQGIRGELQATANAIFSKRQSALEAANEAAKDGTITPEEQALVNQLTDEGNRLSLGVKQRKIHSGAAEGRIRSRVRELSRVFPQASELLRETGSSAIASFSGLTSRNILKEEFPELLEEQQRLQGTIRQVSNDMAKHGLDYNNPLHRAKWASNAQHRYNSENNKADQEALLERNRQLAAKEAPAYYRETLTTLTSDVYEAIATANGDHEAAAALVNQAILSGRAAIENYASGISTVDREAANNLISNYTAYADTLQKAKIGDLFTAATQAHTMAMNSREALINEVFGQRMILNDLGIKPEVQIQIMEFQSQMTAAERTRFIDMNGFTPEEALIGPGGIGGAGTLAGFFEAAQKGEPIDPEAFGNAVFARTVLGVNKKTPGNIDPKVVEAAVQVQTDEGSPSVFMTYQTPAGQAWVKKNPSQFKTKVDGSAAYVHQNVGQAQNIRDMRHFPDLNLIVALDEEGNRLGVYAPSLNILQTNPRAFKQREKVEEILKGFPPRLSTVGGLGGTIQLPVKQSGDSFLGQALFSGGDNIPSDVMRLIGETSRAIQANPGAAGTVEEFLDQFKQAAQSRPVEGTTTRLTYDQSTGVVTSADSSSSGE